MNIEVQIGPDDLIGLSPVVLQAEKEKEFKYEEEGKRYYPPEKRAEMCHKSCTANRNKAISLPCRQWRICPSCFKLRIRTWVSYIRDARKLIGGKWRWKVFPSELATMVRQELKEYGCISFPTAIGEVVLSPYFSDGLPVPTDDAALAKKVTDWVKSPDLKRPWRSKNCIMREYMPQKAKGERMPFFFTASISEVAKIIEDYNGYAEPEGNTIYFGEVSVEQVMYELVLIGKVVNHWDEETNSCIPLHPYATIFDEVRDERAQYARKRGSWHPDIDFEDEPDWF